MKISQIIKSVSEAYYFYYVQETHKYRKENVNWKAAKIKAAFSPDKSFIAEVKAAVNYRTAKAKGIILVSQTW